MGTVWITFAPGTAGGIGADVSGFDTGGASSGIRWANGTGAAAAGALMGAAGQGAADVGAALGDIPLGGPGVGSGKIGIVETTRGAVMVGVFGGALGDCGMTIGVSWRGTSLSPESPFAFAGSALLACELPALGMILVGPSSALMIGGSDGSIEPPNMAR
jgi:hypothetical protein